MRDGWRMTSGVAIERMVDMDPELEAFIPLFPPADPTDAVIARKNLAEGTWAAAARRRAGEERMRIARELPICLAHNISLINVQAGVALHLIDEQPGQS